MPRTRRELIGQTIGKLFVIKEDFSKNVQAWECLCSCGNITIVRHGNLSNGHTTSCGCHVKNMLNNGLVRLRHGQSKGVQTPEYKAWSHMKERCQNKKNKRYYDWGGRGIKVCERWQTFDLFFEDMGKKPSPKHSLERNDNEGNYEPSNCSWEIRRVQDRNKRNNHWIEYPTKGLRMILQDWAEYMNVNRKRLEQMVKRGRNIEYIYGFYLAKGCFSEQHT